MAEQPEWQPISRLALWQYSRPGGAVVFDFRMGREREGPKRFLGDFEGILQSDGYAAYDHVGGPKIVHAACSRTCTAQVLPGGGTQYCRPDRHRYCRADK